MFVKSLKVMLLLVITTVFFNHLVLAQTNWGGMCGLRKDVVDLLWKQFQEEQEEISLASEFELFELFVSEKGTWSILRTTAIGTSCVVKAGNGLHKVAKS